MQRFHITEERIISDRGSTPEDFKSAIAMITAMVAKRKKPDEVMMVLAAAIAVATTVFSPSEEEAKRNRGRMSEFVASVGNDLWPMRSDIEAELTEKVERILPLAELHTMMVELRRANQPDKTDEPQHQQFKI